MIKYQLVTKDKKFYPTLAELKMSKRYLGEYHGVGRDCLQGQPIIMGFCGPMYNGTDESGNIIVRYETTEVYATYN